MSLDLFGLDASFPAFHSPEGQAFVSLPFGPGGHQVVPVHSTGFRDRLTTLFHQHHGHYPKPRKLSQTIRLLSTQAFGPGHPTQPSERPVSVRLAAHSSIPARIVLDLLDDSQTVNIGPDSWALSGANPACFRRFHTQAPLPPPTPTGTPDFEPLARAIRLTHDRPAFLRVLTWLFAAMRPQTPGAAQGDSPYPILLLRGPSGSGKSTAARLLRSLVDPNRSPLLPAPTGRRALIRDASSNWVLAFDHVSNLPTLVSDTLCTLTSGYAHTFRDGDRTVVQNLARPMILVATERLKLHPDLAARCLPVDLDEAAVFKRGAGLQPALSREARQFAPPNPNPNPDAAFDVLRPSLLGSLCTAISQTMSGQYTYATPAELAEALKPVPSPLVRSLHKLGNFKGSATELAAALKWHSTPRHLSQQLRDLTGPAFAIRFFHHHGERKIEITFSASPSSPPPDISPRGLCGAGGSASQGQAPRPLGHASRPFDGLTRDRATASSSLRSGREEITGADKRR
ncbi:MAG: hypothetical protein EXQ52_07595 [Bryobacterales bacterium]|nr:hypothetical protein [Bryobacterales bacterium]